MEFFYSGRGVASIVHWDCLVSIYLSIYIYIYMDFTFVWRGLMIVFYYIRVSIWLLCVHVRDQLVCK